MNCRHCGSPLEQNFLDLGFAPPSNAYLTKECLSSSETYYPLKVMVCQNCWLVQTEDYADADALFTDEYAYFSSTSSSFLNHAKDYSDLIIDRLNLSSESFVIEIASNDGYLLKNFLKRGIPCLGIEPTKSTAKAARKLGLEVIEEFFGKEFAKNLLATHQKADLIIGNNVFAHVPDINDFTAGIKECLSFNGTITLEFPHLMSLINHNQFDTVYHEHFSYLSLQAVSSIFAAAGLKIIDVEKLQTHGGSLRVYGCHAEDSRTIDVSVKELLEEEKHHKLNVIKTYTDFQSKANEIKDSLLSFLLEQKKQGKTIAAYGAAAKGNTLLNFAGIKTDLIKFVADAAEAKQNKYMPGSHIPIVNPAYLINAKFDFLLILPWNIADEIYNQLKEEINPQVKFVTAIPKLKIFS